MGAAAVPSPGPGASPGLSPAAIPANPARQRPPEGVALLAGDGLHIKNGYLNGLLTSDGVAWRHLSGLLCHDGRLSFSEGKDHTIRELNLGDDQIRSFAGRRGAPDEGRVPGWTGLNLPGPMAFLSPFIYVVDTGSHTLKRIREEGLGGLETFTGKVGVKGNQDGLLAEATFSDPVDLVADPDQLLLFVADPGHQHIRMVSAALGAVRTIPVKIQDPQGLALGPDGTLYVANSDQSVIQALVPQDTHDPWNTPWILKTLAGTPGHRGFQDGAGDQALFNRPVGLALTPDGSGLLVADGGNHVIRQVALATGLVTTFAGDPHAPQAGWVDGGHDTARLRHPSRLAFGPSGELYWADQDGQALRKLGLDGRVVTLGANTSASSAGAVDGPPSEVRFRKPLGVAVNSAGVTFVADRGNHAIRRVTPQGEVDTFAGVLGEPGDGDGGGAAARFQEPAEMAIDAVGKLWVLEEPSRRLRVIYKNGNVKTSDLKPTCIAACPFPGPVGKVVMALPQFGHVVEIALFQGTTKEKVAQGLEGVAALALGAQDEVFVLLEHKATQRVILQKYAPPRQPGHAWRLVKELVLGPEALAAKAVGKPVIRGMAVDSRGNLFLADAANGLIWGVDPDLTNAAVVAGTHPFLGPTTGNSPLEAPLYNPHRIAVTPADDLIVTSGNALLRITPPGLPPAPPSATRGRRSTVGDTNPTHLDQFKKDLGKLRSAVLDDSDSDSDSDDETVAGPSAAHPVNPAPLAPATAAALGRPKAGSTAAKEAEAARKLQQEKEKEQARAKASAEFERKRKIQEMAQAMAAREQKAKAPQEKKQADSDDDWE